MSLKVKMENSNWQGNPSGRKRAVDELLRGRELATQLRTVLLESPQEEDAKGLVAKILNSFSNTLSILDGVESDEVSQFPARTPGLGSPYCDSRKSEDSGESSKCSTLIKERRGCYKRRRASESRTVDCPDLVDDGHAWRKYGQKVILNAKHPRSYYRCTHKYDQGCQATKQVQRIEEEPPLYRTIYHGRHTCESKLLRGSQIIADSTDSDSSVFIRFVNNTTSNFASKHDGVPFSITPFPSVKQEQDKEVMPLPSDLTHHNQSSSSNYLLSPDHFSAFDRADVISGVNSSCTASTHSLDMDVIVGAVDFHDDVLQYVEFS